eukprot:15046448-Alexandrium_andersonii.AAC.1
MHHGYEGDSSCPANTDVCAPAAKADHAHPNCGAVAGEGREDPGVTLQATDITAAGKCDR